MRSRVSTLQEFHNLHNYVTVKPPQNSLRIDMFCMNITRNLSPFCKTEIVCTLLVSFLYQEICHAVLQNCSNYVCSNCLRELRSKVRIISFLLRTEDVEWYNSVNKLCTSIKRMNDMNEQNKGRSFEKGKTDAQRVKLRRWELE